MVTPFTLTEIGPEFAPGGTVVVIKVVLAASTTATVPLKVTILFDSSESKFCPVIFTIAPTNPLAGFRLLMTGVGIRIKLVVLINLIPLTVTHTLPVDAPTGTITVILVDEEAVTSALTSLT